MLLVLLACAPYPEGLRATPAGDGPVVRVDWDAKPLPDVPFPNDLGTRVDPTSPTGLRLNVPLETVTHAERESREKLNTLTGFGIYAPMSVGFSARLDLENVRTRHTLDAKLGDAAFEDDAIYVVDVNPDSPDYLRPVALDVGSGRYPLDVPNSARYFPNDSRSQSPTLVFDTVEEDLNGNGQLDWGEDTDYDGVLDHPNVWPEGGDARDDLLSWYELETDTLVFRPVRPLREKNTYAIVLTERLVGADGNPVRSPWQYVHHLRQSEALGPLQDALPALGLAMEDVAFAWTFTTGDVTGDLRAARNGLLGKGTLSALDGQFPEGVGEALQMHEIDDLDDETRLPASRLIGTLAALGLFDGAGADLLVENYTAFADSVVGGSFVTPNFFGEPGQSAGEWPAVDDSDDYWQIDGFNGTYAARPERVAFTCVLPKDAPQPVPVVAFGHGYGSSRFDFLGFAWAFNRVGMAACAFDYPGHGPTVSPDEEAQIEAVLGATGFLPFYDHLKDARYRDLDNDGISDSGGDQWTADAFHTRDMVRQAAIDHAQFLDSVRACGTGEMTRPDGSTAVSCDWDGDGTPDIGADAKLYQIGGSLGGINTAVAAAVIDEVTAWAPVVPGGGLLDVALRTEIGGAVEAMHGRLMSPLFFGYPTGDGGLRVVQMVNSVTDMYELEVGTLPSFPAGGKVVLENLANGEVREGAIPTDGSFRIGIAADAMSAWEKRNLAGIPEDGPADGTTYWINDPTEAGDPLAISFYSADGELVSTLDTWSADTTFQGVTYPAGSPLVAAAEGYGYIRSTPRLRRIAFVFGAILEGGDPIGYARNLTEEPFDGAAPRNILMMPTPGDSIVSINTGIALARGAGWLDDTTIDDRYGTTVDRFLIDRRVVQGLEQFGPYTCSDGAPCLFDADDLDQGLDGTGATSDAPLRVVHETSSGTSALRLPYVRTTGTHGFAIPEPDRAFDMATFASMQMATYFLNDGQSVSDDLCLEDASCAWIPQLPGSGDTGDTGPIDTGPIDTGPPDTGPDSGTDTSGSDTSGGADTSPADTATDTAAARRPR